ncbi:MAG: ABC transporter permease [Bacteroidaceae bacterium]|nr:ABC transporter permease [Bacteroidaceae bacterium]
MKIAFKNFITTLKRFKVASLLNVVGLTLAFAAFYIIMAQVYSAFTYNGSIKDNERIYMISPYSEMLGRYNENAPNPVSYETAEALPVVESIASMAWYESPTHVWINGNGNGYEKFKCGVTKCNSTLLDVFSFGIVAGNTEDFGQMNAAVVSESMAKTMGITVGDVIKLEEGELVPGTPLTVVAIFEDFDENTILGGRHIFRNDNRKDGLVNNNWNYSVFVKFREGAGTDEYIALWQKRYYEFNESMYEQYIAATGTKISKEEKEKLCKLEIKLVPMDEFYFNTQFENYLNGSIGTTITQLAIALVIVIVAFINFVNFFMALVPVRMRTVNICKVFGASSKTLRWNFIFEAVGLVLIALVIAFYMIYAVQGTGINEYVNFSLAMGDNAESVVLVCTVAIIMAVAAAVYPAFYITGFNASLAVKKGFANSKAGRALRSGLVALQFTVSMVLMVLALVFSMQYSYMVRYDIGVDRENMLMIKSEDLAPKHELFIETLAANPNIEAVTSTNWGLFGSGDYNSRLIDGVTVKMQIHYVRHNAPQVFGIPVIMGHGFVKGSPGYLITDYTSQATGLGIGDKWDNEEIIGIIPHINFVGANKAKMNTMLYSQASSDYRMYFYVRLGKNVDIEEVCADIRAIAKEIEPNADEPKIEFVDDAVARIYGDTKKQTVLISMFAFIAVVISLMGVFGIVMFETQHRRSEIAVRKVYGATVGGVVAMFNRRYLAIIVLCFVIAAPVAWLIADNWLQQFVNRIELAIWLPLSVLVAVAVVTVALVSVRSLKAATENPADVVKSN